MKNARLIVMALLGLALQSAVMAQSLKTEVARIGSYCRGIDALTKNSRTPDLIFADTSDPANPNAKPKWRRFATEKALEKFRKANETYSIAYNWRHGGKIVAANFTNFSESGDWAMYIFHCFRPDGTLARATSELRTFNGDYIITQTRYFNARGKQIDKTVKYQDLTSHKIKRPTKDYESSFSDDDIFTTTAKVPFAKLIIRK